MLDTGAKVTILGIGVAALFGECAAMWRVASLKGDTNKQWARRVDFAVTALDEKTLTELGELRNEIDALLPAYRTDPLQAIADPGPVSRRAESAASLYRTRRRMESDLKHLSDLGPLVFLALVGLALATGGLAISYADVVAGAGVRIAAYVFLAASCLALVVLGSAYARLQHRLSTAEIRAGSAGDA